MDGLRMFVVCVDYGDLLAHTLPVNAHHFDEIHVITSLRDLETGTVTQRIGELFNRRINLYATDDFYKDGAHFNKWLALENALTHYGRHGWICLMDADVLWPRLLPQGWLESLQVGKLYTPMRRMYPSVQPPYPGEQDWKAYKIHRNVNEWAGYSQIFHGTDPALPSPPWHQTNWIHAGGADSFFQRLWKPEDKIRPPWECLHLGPAGENWCGRVTEKVGGSPPEEAGERRSTLEKIFRERRSPQKRRREDPFSDEKIQPDR